MLYYIVVFSMHRCGTGQIMGRFWTGTQPLFSPSHKPRDVFHLLSPMLIKCMRNNIKALFVLLIHKMVDIVYSFLCLSVRYFLQRSPFWYVHTGTLFFGGVLVSPDCFSIWGKFKSVWWMLEGWNPGRNEIRGHMVSVTEIFGSKTHDTLSVVRK